MVWRASVAHRSVLFCADAGAAGHGADAAAAAAAAGGGVLSAGARRSEAGALAVRLAGVRKCHLAAERRRLRSWEENMAVNFLEVVSSYAVWQVSIFQPTNDQAASDMHATL